MKTLNHKATSIAETIIVMFIIVTGVVGMYNIYMSSVKLENTTKNKIKAIEIAKEGIEAMINIRNTNWLIFGGNQKDCWNTRNYNAGCIGNQGNNAFGHDKKYILYNDQFDRWMTQEVNIADSLGYDDIAYKNLLQLGLTNTGFYTQSGSTQELKPIFTREIKTSYIDTNNDGNIDSFDEKMEVLSRVQWRDSSSNNIQKVELKTLLSNWED